MTQSAKILCAAIGAAAVAATSLPADAALTVREESIVPIAAFTANGNEAALKSALETGLKNGLTVTEIRSVLEQMYAYTGFPRSLTGLGVFVNLLKEHKAKGVEDVTGREAKPLPPNTSIRVLGTKTQTTLIGKPAASPVYDFSPNIDTYLKEHLFGDIFANDILTWRERELATVAALAALPAPVQLRSHLNVCLNVGLQPDELKAFAEVVGKEVGETQGKLARESVAAVLKARSK